MLTKGARASFLSVPYVLRVLLECVSHFGNTKLFGLSPRFTPRHDGIVENCISNPKPHRISRGSLRNLCTAMLSLKANLAFSETE